MITPWRTGWLLIRGVISLSLLLRASVLSGDSPQGTLMAWGDVDLAGQHGQPPVTHIAWPCGVTGAS
jgi:hypothetical protein